MKAVVVGIVLALAVVSAILLTPTRFLLQERHRLAQTAMQYGFSSVAATVLRPLASAGDARALNNLGTLYVHGAGVEKDLAAAQRAFRTASTRGSIRARLNLALVSNGGCTPDVPGSAATAADVQPLVRRDPAAAALVQDCLYFDETSRHLPDRNERFIRAGEQVQRGGEPAALLQSGWALLNLARTTQRPEWDNDQQMADYRRTVIPIARKAMETLFAAADAGATGAYEPIGILGMQFGELLEGDPLAARLRDKDNWEWIEEGAAKGDWEGQCKVAQARINHLRWDGRDYTRTEFDDAVKLARGCINRKEESQAPSWHDGAEWLVVTPRRSRARPHLVVVSTEAELNGLLFFDADKQLGNQTPDPGRAPSIQFRGSR